MLTLEIVRDRSRGVTLVVSDDRTHKVTSAYMHITCAFRKAGCPFILKLTKAKEGGWVLKGAKALEGTSSFFSEQRLSHSAVFADSRYLLPSQVELSISNSVQSIVVVILQEQLLNFQLLPSLILSSAIQLPLTLWHQPRLEEYQNLKQLEYLESLQT